MLSAWLRLCYRMEWATPLLEQVCAILSKVPTIGPCVCEEVYAVVSLIPQKSSETGERHPQLVTCLNELASIYRQQVSTCSNSSYKFLQSTGATTRSDFSSRVSAITQHDNNALLTFLHRKVVALKERETSSGHTSVAAALNNLAVLHCLLVISPSHSLNSSH